MIRSGSFLHRGATHLYFRIQPAQSDLPALLLLHGHSLDHRMWEPQMAALTPHFRVIRPDLRGYGRSDPPDPSLDFRYTDDLEALLDALEISQTHVVGLSLGGNVALDFALHHPQRVNQLILVDSSLSGFPPFPGVAESLGAIFDRAKEAGIDAARKLWLEHPLFEAASEQPQVAQQLRSIVEDYSGWHWVNRYSPSRPIDPSLIEHLEQISVPTSVVIGARDTPQNLAIADLLAQRIPLATKVVVGGAGHMVNLESPSAFNQILLKHLTGSKQ